MDRARSSCLNDPQRYVKVCYSQLKNRRRKLKPERKQSPIKLMERVREGRKGREEVAGEGERK